MSAPVASPPAAVSPTDDADVALVFALAVEADAFDRLVAHRRETSASRFAFLTGTVAGRRVAWCTSGVGRAAATAAVRQLIDGHRPRLLITAGFAGGLDSVLRRGDAVRPDVALADPSGARISLASSRHGSGGLTIVSVDEVAATVDAKRALAARTGAQLVDMETFAVAEAAAAAGLPCAAVRVISDDATETLPAEVASLARPQSSLHRLGAAFGAIGRRPRAALDLWRLWERSVLDSRTLADEVVHLIRESG